VYAGVVADAALLAARDPNSVGEAYNITSHCRITQREFLDMLAFAVGVPRVTWHYPFWYAFYGGFSLELRERLLLSKKPPRVTRYGAWLLGRYLEYSTRKARERLGWSPALSYRESIERTVRWFMDDEASRVPHDPMPPLVRISFFFNYLRRALAPPGFSPAASSPAADRREVPQMVREHQPPD
jgi:nucleoside-diphosphate-sugar epimerase